MNTLLRAWTVAAAAGSELNDEITILVNALAELDRAYPHARGDPVEFPLIEMRAAAQRCKWIAGDLLGFGQRGGVIIRRCVSLKTLME